MTVLNGVLLFPLTKSTAFWRWQEANVTFPSKTEWKNMQWTGNNWKGTYRFFAWLLVQSKLLTADKLLARNWPCNPVCSLCDQAHESAEHLALQCVFAWEVWHLVADWSDGMIQVPRVGVQIEEWWNLVVKGLPKNMKRNKAAIMVYTAWNVWKERRYEVRWHDSKSEIKKDSTYQEQYMLRQILASLWNSMCTCMCCPVQDGSRDKQLCA